MGLPWTNEEIRILREMAEARKSPKQIVAVLRSRTEHAIVYKAKEMGIAFRCYEPEIDLDAFNRLMKRG
jgi:hypothetical protein